MARAGDCSNVVDGECARGSRSRVGAATSLGAVAERDRCPMLSVRAFVSDLMGEIIGWNASREQMEVRMLHQQN